MPFNSISFIFFFIFFSITYYLTKPLGWKKILLIIGSYLFYSFGSISNLFHLVFVTIVTIFFSIQIKKHDKKNFLLFTAVLIIVAQLVLTKYSHLFLNSIFKEEISFIYTLPIGISFYSLQSIAFLIDVKNGKYQGAFDQVDIVIFLSFFPQSIAGPIHRAKELIPQIRAEKIFNADNIVIGIKTMLWGFFCKLIVADKISLITSPFFNSFSENDGLTLFLSMLLYSIQIYFDFWGYSLIAIGTGRVLGFQININFKNPYMATSFKDFWHRWHITLSKWMRDYIYFPLGGSKQKYYLAFCFAVLVTFLVSGLWHGVSFNFILWGTVHGVLYLLEDFLSKFFSKNRLGKFLSKYIIVIKPLKHLIFIIIITITWLIFRTENYLDLVGIMYKTISFESWSLGAAKTNFLTTNNLIYLMLIVLALTLSNTSFLNRRIEVIAVSKREYFWDSIYLSFSLVTIILFGDMGSQEFLYFQF